MTKRWWIRRVGAALVALAAVLAWVGPAGAHEALVTKSEPADGELLAEPPAQVTVWFAEELQTGVSALTVHDAQGKQVDQGGGGVDLNDAYHARMVVSLPPLADGAYVVRYHVVLLDGDATDGEYVFYVGDQFVPLPAAPAAEPAAASTAESSAATGARFPIGPVLAGAGVLVALLIVIVLARRGRAG